MQLAKCSLITNIILKRGENQFKPFCPYNCFVIDNATSPKVSDFSSNETSFSVSIQVFNICHKSSCLSRIHVARQSNVVNIILSCTEIAPDNNCNASFGTSALQRANCARVGVPPRLHSIAFKICRIVPADLQFSACRRACSLRNFS